MRDVLVVIAARNQPAVNRLDDAPSERRVVGRAEDQRAIILQHPAHLGEQAVVVRHVLDDLRADEAIEAVVLEWQGEGRRLRERYAVTAQKAQLREQEVHPDRVVEALDDDAGAASGVKDALVSPRPLQHDAVAAALPVALDWDDAIKRALVVIRRIERIAHLP